MKNFTNLFIILFILFFISCSKDDKQQNPKTTKQENESVNPSDTMMTPEEKFSSSIMIDFLDEPEDDDLEAFIQDELFKYSKDYRGASVLQLTNNVWFVTLENKNLSKNFLLQKFVDFNTNEYYFVLKETPLAISDVITSADLYRNSNSKNSKETQNPQVQTPK